MRDLEKLCLTTLETQKLCGNFSLEFICIFVFKFLERDGNRGPWPASVILIGLDWIDVIELFKMF